MEPDTIQDLIIYLCRHEEDIKLGVNDFADLQQVFMDVVGYAAGSTQDDKSIW